ALVGPHAQRGADADVPGADARRVPRRGHRTGGDGPELARRRPARPVRPAAGQETLNMPLLEVRDLSVQLQTHRGPALAVRDVSFTLDRGDTLGIVGESGCGKSITVMA